MRGLYERIEADRDQYETNVRLSYLEIYNETIRDLLSPTPTPPGPGLALREDAASKISVVGITEHIPESPEQVLEMITEGNKRRTQSPTMANAVSSRSHAVLQLNVTRKPRTAGTVEEMCSASLNIIDLAGSERASATNNHGMRMKEGANINRSLLALGSCINALCQTGGSRNTKGRHIPYRNSKLTRLLKFSLGGNCKTVMIVCVSPSSAHYEETHNTLKYANQAKNIQTKVTRNLLHIDRHVAQYVQAIASLREEVQELKHKLAVASSGDAPAERRKKAERETQLAEATSQLQAAAEAATESERAAAAEAAPTYAADAIRSALIAALATCTDEDRGILQTILDQTPQTQPPPESVYALPQRTLPPAAAADTSCAALYAARHAHLEAHLAAEARHAALVATRRVQQSIGGRMVDLALSAAHSTQALQSAATELDDELDDEARAALVEQLRATSHASDLALQRAMGTSVRGVPPARAKPKVNPSPRRKARPSTGQSRALRLVSPRRRALRPSMPARHKSIGAALDLGEKPQASEPRKSLAPRPSTARPLAPRPSVAPSAPRPSVAPSAPRPSIAPGARPNVASGAARAAPRPSVPPRKVEKNDKAPRASLAPKLVRPRAEPEKRPEPEKRAEEKRPEEKRPEDKRAPASPPMDEGAYPPVSPTMPAEPCLSPLSPTGAHSQKSPGKSPPVKRRGLFQRQFLARPEAEEGDSSMDSFLHTDLGDLSAQLPREDWQTGLLDAPGQGTPEKPFPARFRVEPHSSRVQ